MSPVPTVTYVSGRTYTKQPEQKAKGKQMLSKADGNLYDLAKSYRGRAHLAKLPAKEIQKWKVTEICAIHPIDKVPALYWLAVDLNGFTVLAKLSEAQIQVLVKTYRLQKCGKLVFSHTSITYPFVLMRKNALIRRTDFGVPSVLLFVLIFHIIFLDSR